MVGVEILRLDVLGLVEAGQSGCAPRIHQVERDLGLAVDHHRLAGGPVQIDPVTFAAEGKLDSLVDQTFAVGAGARADLVE